MRTFDINFHIVYGLLIIAGFSFATSPQVVKTEKFNNQLICLFSFLFFVLFGSRAFPIGTDTLLYIRFFQEGIPFPDIGFNILADLFRLISNNGRFFLYAMAFLFMLPICLFFYKIKYENKFLLFFFFVHMIFFVNMGINGLRQGIALSLFLLSIYYSEKMKIVGAGLLFFVSFLFHYSMIIPIVLYLVSRKLKTITIPLLCFLIAAVLSILAFNFTGFLRSIPVLGSWSLLMDRVAILEQPRPWVEPGDRYYFRTGFRLDFFMYNLFFAVVGVYFYSKCFIKSIPQYKTYLSTFLFTSAVFFLMFQLPYSNRIGYFSWVFIPFIMLPIIQNVGALGKFGALEKFGKIFSLLFVIAIHVLLVYGRH